MWTEVVIGQSAFTRVATGQWVTAANKAAWAAGREQEPWLPLRPSGDGNYPFGQVVRLGGLTPPAHHDLRWEIVPGIPTEPVAHQVVDAIERHGLPWLRSQAGG